MRIPELRVNAGRRSPLILAAALVCIGCAPPAAQVEPSPFQHPGTDTIGERVCHHHADAIGHV